MKVTHDEKYGLMGFSRVLVKVEAPFLIELARPQRVKVSGGEIAILFKDLVFLPHGETFLWAWQDENGMVLYRGRGFWVPQEDIKEGPFYPLPQMVFLS